MRFLSHIFTPADTPASIYCGSPHIHVIQFSSQSPATAIYASGESRGTTCSPCPHRFLRKRRCRSCLMLDRRIKCVGCTQGDIIPRCLGKHQAGIPLVSGRPCVRTDLSPGDCSRQGCEDAPLSHRTSHRCNPEIVRSTCQTSCPTEVM